MEYLSEKAGKHWMCVKVCANQFHKTSQQIGKYLDLDP